MSIEEKTKPGPGHYESPTRMGKGPAYEMGKKYKDLSDNKIPGPGYYEVKESRTSRAYKMSETKRTEIVAEEHARSPSPGQYDNDFNTCGKKSIGYTISSTKRV